MDNIAYQPRRGSWLIQEDGDSPAAVPTINDLTAETTGGIFDARSSRYWVSVQHNITGHGVVLEISGWR